MAGMVSNHVHRFHAYSGRGLGRLCRVWDTEGPLRILPTMRSQDMTGLRQDFRCVHLRSHGAACTPEPAWVDVGAYTDIPYSGKWFRQLGKTGTALAGLRLLRGSCGKF